MSKNSKLKSITKFFATAAFSLGLIATPILTSTSYALDQTWGPQDRERFTWDSPASFVTFNSMKDNPFIGDETNFVRVKEYVEGGENGGWVDNVTVEPGKQYEVFIYIHNNASASLNNANGDGLALNTRVASSFPTKLVAGDSGVIKGSVSASNATPNAVWDTAFFKADQTVYLSYIDNTAVLHTSDNCKSTDGTILSADSFFASDAEVGSSDSVGAMIACYNSDDLWGVIPGCNEYAGYVTYRVRVDQPAFWTEKTVSASGLNNYSATITANPGDTLDFKLYYKNTGTTNQIDVVAHDALPAGMAYVSGSVKVTTPAGVQSLNTTQEEKFFSSSATDGLIIGDFRPDEEATITYQVKVLTEDKFSCGENALYNEATIQTANGSEYDKALVTVNRSCSSPTTPSSLPTTGPGEIAMVIAIVLIIGGGAFYLYRSQKMLRKVTTAAGGDNTDNIVLDGIKNNVNQNNAANNAANNETQGYVAAAAEPVSEPAEKVEKPAEEPEEKVEEPAEKPEEESSKESAKSEENSEEKPAHFESDKF